MALSPEVFLISSIVQNREFVLASNEGLTPDMFHVCHDEFAWLANYYKRYRKEPTKAAFARAFSDFRFKNVNDTRHFVDEVKKSHTRAQMTEAMSDQADLLAQGKVTEAADLALRTITKIAGGMSDTAETDVLQDWKPMYNEVRARKLRFDEFGMAGIPTGFDTLDDRTGGIGRGQLWVVAARLGHGKSGTLLEMATAAILNGYRAFFWAGEMSQHEVQMRLHNLLSSSTGRAIYQANQLAQGRDFNIADYRKFLNDLSKQIKGTLIVSDKKGIGAMEIAAQIERHQPDVYFLDYLTLCRMKGDGGWQDVGNLTKELKEIAGRYETGLVTAAQLNRQGNDSGKEPPGAETIGSSDQIGQDADAVITLKQMSARVIMYKLAKYRHGPSGYCWYSIRDMANGVFEEVSKNRAMEVMDLDADIRDQEIEAGPTKKIARPKLRPVPDLPIGAGRKGLRKI